MDGKDGARAAPAVALLRPEHSRTIAVEQNQFISGYPTYFSRRCLETMRVGFQVQVESRLYKIRRGGGPDRRGVGFYFRNVTELVLFGFRGKNIER